MHHKEWVPERICIRLDQVPRFQRYDPVPCAECGALVVHNERTTDGFRFVCMECLIGETP